MPVRKGHATWSGGVRDPLGRIELGSDTVALPFSLASRTEDEPGTNPEELLAAAHASCFTMDLNNRLVDAGFVPTHTHTTASVSLEQAQGQLKLTRIVLRTDVTEPNIEADAFQHHAQAAKAHCAISRALAATPIELEAYLHR